MESEDSPNEEDVSMKLLPNEGEVPDYKSGGNEDVSISRSQESENALDTFVDWEVYKEHMKVLRYFHNC